MPPATATRLIVGSITPRTLHSSAYPSHLVAASTPFHWRRHASLPPAPRVRARCSSSSHVSRNQPGNQHSGRGSAPATMAEDRSWMYAGRPSRRRITPEWAEKATGFVERAFRRAPPGRDVPCPCARCRCRNRLPRSKFDMQIHLGREGFMPDYTVWVHHGESRTAKSFDDLPEDNDNQVASGAGDAVSKPQGAKTKKRTISDIEVYAVARQLSEEDRIEWNRQMYLWEMKKLQQQQQQQNAPKRLRTSGVPPAELAQDECNKDANSCASSCGSI